LLSVDSALKSDSPLVSIRHLTGRCDRRAQPNLFIRRREASDVIVVRIEQSGRTLRIPTGTNPLIVTDHYVHFRDMLIPLSAARPSDLAKFLARWLEACVIAVH